jgi:hypothetical protein
VRRVEQDPPRGVTPEAAWPRIAVIWGHRRERQAAELETTLHKPLTSVLTRPNSNRHNVTTPAPTAFLDDLQPSQPEILSRLENARNPMATGIVTL